MKLKLNGDGTAVITNGFPVYTHDDGSEAPFDAAASVEKTRDLEAALMSEKIAVNFDRSRMVAEKLSVPPDLVRAKFGNAFKLEDGKVVAFDKNGNKIYSRARPGEVADFDEALAVLIDAYPSRDSIIKKTGTPGGHTGGAGNSRGGGRTLTRSALAALAAAAQSAHFKSGGTVVDG
jgi:hypothetical protein